MSKIWYMRDNHTFRGLPPDVDSAMLALRDEFDGGQTYGMLCTKEGPMRHKNENAGKNWIEFAPRARAWLVAAMKPTAEDVEYDSWLGVLNSGAYEGLA